MLPFLAWLGVTLLWLLLPLLPALRELWRPTDIAPLKVVDRSAGLVSYFARNFRQYLDTALPPEAGAGDYAGKLLDGTDYLRVNLRPAALSEDADRSQNRLVVLDTPVTLPPSRRFLMELFARAPLTGGSNGVYRAVYAERELELGFGSQVLRWAHAGGRLGVGDRSELGGRISSDTAVVLGSGVRFERIGAPLIAVQAEHEPPPRPPTALPLHRLPEQARRVGDHIRIEGDFEIPTGMRVSGDLVVTGRLRLGLGAILEGNAKAHGRIEVANEAQIYGSAVTRTELWVGAAAWIGGPVIAERRVRLGRGAVVGSSERPATLVAAEVELATGATVYGQISALRRAQTL